MAEIWVGTSGWRYKHWIGPVYPPGTRNELLLPLYAKRFRTVEINTTFYGLPKPATVQAWAAATPEGFVFACKASRYLTHIKRLKDPAEGLGRLFGVIDELGTKLGPVLFQLPPRWRADPGRLRAFLDALSRGQRCAFEFRDPSWFVDPVFDALAAQGAALCFYDVAGHRSPVALTAPFVYLRLHGPVTGYTGSYDEASLNHYAASITAWRAEGRDVYCYFNNDVGGRAVWDAERLLGKIESRSGPV